jgi:hypothetical protein
MLSEASFASDEKDAAIYILSYATVAANSCKSYTLNEYAFGRFMASEGISPSSLDGENKLAVRRTLESSFKLYIENPVGFCDTAYLLLGSPGYISPGVLEKR